MGDLHREPMADGRLLRLTLTLASSPVSHAEVLRQWQQDADFRSLFLAVLADAPFTAFRWETPPITAAAATRPFECVLLDSPGLSRSPDAEAFAEHFVNAGGSGVVEFPNLTSAQASGLEWPPAGKRPGSSTTAGSPWG